jgi:hypothetical protein
VLFEGAFVNVEPRHFLVSQFYGRLFFLHRYYSTIKAQ